MYAVIQNGAHQYRVQLGQFIKIEKLGLEPGQLWKCNEILAFQDQEGRLTVGSSGLKRAEVQGRVIRHGKSKKILVFKKKRRKGYRRTQGHRQEFTEIYIELMSAPSGEQVERKLTSKSHENGEKSRDEKSAVLKQTNKEKKQEQEK